MTQLTVPRAETIDWPRTALALTAGAVAVGLVMQVSYIGAGLLYAILFFVLAWSRPELALMLIFAVAPFQQDLAGGGPVRFSIAEINLTIACAVLATQNLMKRRPLRASALLVPVVLYLAVCFIASMLHWRGGDALSSMLQMVLYMVAAVLVFASMVDRREQLMPALYGLVVVCTGLAVVMLASGGQYVLGLHKNGAGASLAAGFVVATELWFITTDRRRRMLLTVAMAIIGIGLVFALSRGAWMAAFAGVGVIFIMRRQFRQFFRLAMLGLPVLAACWLALPQHEREYVFGFEAERRNIQARYDIIEFTWAEFRSSPVIGVGVGLRKQADATNIVLFTLAETGVLGLITFGLIHAVFLRQVWSAQKHVSRHDPMYCVLAIGAALVVGRFTHGLVDHYWSRGVVMMAWAGAGMATLACLTVRQQARQWHDEGVTR